MPFNPFKRKPGPDEAAAAAQPAPPPPRDLPGRPIPFEGLTEEWRLVGVMHLQGRLSDALNRREAVPISDVTWAPIDGSGALEPAPGLQSVDPYDLIVVLTGPDSLPLLSESEKAAHKVHKVSYDVAVEAPPFRILGTVFLYPGSEPERLMDRATEMFVPLIDATAYIGDRRIGEEVIEVVLVNRFYLRGIAQIDRRTGERHTPFPGDPLGGTSWQEKAR